MSRLDNLRDQFRDPMRDIKLNVQSVLAEGGALNAAQRLGVALASAGAARDSELTEAILELCLAEAGQAVVDDALAASALMAMNNVYYRFRHLVGKAAYSERPARLRMTRIAKPATNKADFELFCLAVSAINACESCIRSHEEAVLAGGLTEEHVHDAVRIASTIHAAAVSLELSRLPSAAG
ncbi:MAG TPA: carboxymuconolactone decarboxylase family protein [Polyangiaceae bacterium]|nr:carboxymuconolactone decarboxylase family protein [Polyangiaceae bacterium]